MESVGPRDREIQGLQCTVTDVLIIISVRIHISMIRVKNSSSHISQTFNKKFERQRNSRKRTIES